MCFDRASVKPTDPERGHRVHQHNKDVDANSPRTTEINLEGVIFDGLGNLNEVSNFFLYLAKWLTSCTQDDAKNGGCEPNQGALLKHLVNVPESYATTR
jgi:hypothetical protein